MLTFVFKSAHNTTIHLAYVEFSCDNGKCKIDGDQFNTAIQEAHRIILKDLSLLEVKDREPRYFHIQTEINGTIDDALTVDVCVKLL